MSYIVRANAILPKTKAWTVNQTAETQVERERRRIPTRRADITWLDAEGGFQTKSTVIPAIPMFQEAFSALGQGTIVATTEGAVAVEDLVPGMQVVAANGKKQTIRWIGAMTVLPNSPDLNLPEARLYRVTEGGFGLDRGAPDLMLGQAARILPGVEAIDSSSPLRDIDDLADGFSVIEIRPMSPVRLFHIVLDEHSLFRANGVLVESYHPGTAARLNLPAEMFEIFLGIFPQMRNEGDFGPVNHRRGLPDIA